jgi:tRNA (guanine-N7-)-methyltransferase
LPHILVKSTSHIPHKEFEVGAYRFQKPAVSSQTTDSLIVVYFKDIEFVLIKKKNKDGELIKFDKTTRVLPIETIKNAIDSYAKFHSLEVLFSNIQTKKDETCLHNSIVHIDKFEDDKIFKTAQNRWKNISMEVGFGSGRHILYMASNNPDTLYIGVEIHTASVKQLNKQIAIQNIKNIVITNCDARQLLSVFPTNFLQNIYVHFPVPWDDKPHRRVINHDFIDQSIRVLKTQGALNLRTDSENYFRYSKQLFDKYDHIETKLNTDIGISSKYEDRWKKMHKNIYDIVFVNQNQDIFTNTSYDFGFLDTINYKNVEKAVKTKKFLFDDHFLSFGFIYLIDEQTYIFALTLGAFDRPTKRYLLVSCGVLRYFQNKPIATKENIKAHKNLLKVLYDD